MEKLYLQPYDWVLRESERDEENEWDVTVIHCWALDRKSRPHLLRISDFPVTCMLELPKNTKWTAAKARMLAEDIASRLGSRAHTGHQYGMYKKIYYYDFNARYPMLRLSFRSTGDMWNCKRILGRGEFYSRDFGKMSIPVWETDIKPVRKMLTAAGLGFAQWLSADGVRVEDDWRVSTLEREYAVSWETLAPVLAEHCRDWHTYPAAISVDIETYSPNHRAMPNALLLDHVVHMISCIYQRVGKPETRERLCIVLGDCDPIPGTTVISVASEEAVVLAMTRYICEKDPEIITGYNTHKYDFKYLTTRITTRLNGECKCEWPNITRLRNGVTTCVEDSWSSSGYGHVQTSRLEMEGRVSIDLYPAIKRDYKLDKYTLDFVSRHFIADTRGKHDISAQQMFEIYEANRAAETGEQRARAAAATATVAAYCVQDSELVLDLIDRLNIWIGLIEMSTIMGVTITDLFTRGQQVRCMSQLYDIAAPLGYIVDHREVEGYTYKGGFVGEPVPGLYENVICLDFNSLYPSLIIAYNICWSTLVPPHLVDQVPDDDVHTFEFDQEEDVKGADEEPDIFESSRRKCAKKGAEKRVAHYKFKFYKREKGLLPTLVETLVNKRKAVNAEKSKLDEYSLLYRILDKRQMALKVSANSFYGFLGVENNGKMPLLEGAMTVTYMGRKNISLATDYMTETYGAKFIYADIDSSMVSLPQITERAHCQEWGERLAQEISGWKAGDPLPGYGYRAKQHPDKVHASGQAGIFPPPLRMEFEKAMRILCLCKKKYAYFKIEPDGSFKPDKSGKRNHVEKKGIIIARRGNPAHLQRTYENVLYNILDKQSHLSSLDLVIAAVSDLVDGRVPPERLVAIRELGANYVNPNFFMARFKTNLTRAGVHVSPGDRLGFVVVHSDDKKAPLGDRMRLDEKYYLDPEPIDVEYYLKNILVNPLDQLLSIGYKDELKTLYHVSFPVNRSKSIYLREATKILYKMFLAGRPASELREQLLAGYEHLKLPAPTLRVVPAHLAYQFYPSLANTLS